MAFPITHALRLRSYRDLGLVLLVGALVLGPIGFLAWMGMRQGLGDILTRAGELDLGERPSPAPSGGDAQQVEPPGKHGGAGTRLY